MFKARVYFILELVAVNGGTATAGASGVTGLKHEVGDDAVKDDIVVVAALG